MRLVVLVMSALLLTCVSARAQTPPPPPVSAPTQGDQQLDRYLQRWEQEMQKVQTLSAQLERIEKDKAFNTTQKFLGWAQYMKSGTGPTAMNLATLEMRQEKRNEIHEKFICTGTFLYQFSPAKKEIHAFDLPKKEGGQMAEDSFLTLLFGVKAAEARRRYDLKMTNEDDNYIYVMIQPRFAQDKADFQRARIVLSKGTFLPRQLWFEQPNGGEVTWNIPAIKTNVQLNRADFDKPVPPPDWKLIQEPRNTDTPPRVIRGQ
jgi:TIGR03009 family protein